MTVTIKLDTIKDNLFNHTKVKHTNQLLATYVIAKYGVFKTLKNNDVIYNVHALDNDTGLIKWYDLRDILNDLVAPVIVNDTTIKDVRTFLKPLRSYNYRPIINYNLYVKAQKQEKGETLKKPLTKTEVLRYLNNYKDVYNQVNIFLNTLDHEVNKLNKDYDFK